jgi:dTDP-4-dehydrorhamnose reductase
VRVLLFGRQGRIGSELQRSLAPLGELLAPDRDNREWPADLASPQALAATVRSLRPDVIVNAAAYTAVDQAEREPELACRINAEAPAVLAREAAALGAWLVHYSTDYVFDDEGPAARDEHAEARPLSIYGQSKLAGEQAIRAQAGRHLILRTGWIQSASRACFVHTILQQAMAMSQLRVVDDQVGAPTGADLVANVTARLLRTVAAGRQDLSGTYHLVAGGETSWHGCARHAVARAHAAGLPLRATASAVIPIRSADLHLPARRPLNSRLDTGKLRRAFGLDLPEWREGVDRMVDTVVATMQPGTPR